MVVYFQAGTESRTLASFSLLSKSWTWVRCFSRAACAPSRRESMFNSENGFIQPSCTISVRVVVFWAFSLLRLSFTFVGLANLETQRSNHTISLQSGRQPGKHIRVGLGKHKVTWKSWSFCFTAIKRQTRYAYITLLRTHDRLVCVGGFVITGGIPVLIMGISWNVLLKNAGKVPSSRALLSLFARSLSGIEYFARELFAGDLGTQEELVGKAC